jgi:hypothetical protein
MMNELRSSNYEIRKGQHSNAKLSVFIIPYYFVIRHSDFVIFPSFDLGIVDPRSGGLQTAVSRWSAV